MLRPSPNHGTQRLPNDDDDDDGLSRAAKPFLEVVLQSGTIIQDGRQNCR